MPYNQISMPYMAGCYGPSTPPPPPPPLSSHHGNPRGGMKMTKTGQCASCLPSRLMVLDREKLCLYLGIVQVGRPTSDRWGALVPSQSLHQYWGGGKCRLLARRDRFYSCVFSIPGQRNELRVLLEEAHFWAHLPSKPALISHPCSSFSCQGPAVARLW